MVTLVSHVACIDETTKAVVSDPDIWSKVVAWAYPATAPNMNGTIGLTAFYGSGSRHPSHAVGMKTDSGWSTLQTKASTNSPEEGAWGDYLTCTAHPENAGSWVASGYTLQGGGSRKDIEPLYVEFAE